MGFDRQIGDFRFIPTPVGNAPPRPHSPGDPSVHPHARGERGSRAGVCPGRPGSSPRPWGTPLGAVGGQIRARFIPTPVGNAILLLSGAENTAVHPHARGERSAQIARIAPAIGSSPRPWGTPAALRCGLRVSRFIPTPVGNAFPRTRRSLAGAVHPHARGERASHSTHPSASTGSSPRPWGTRDALTAEMPASRFIPTPVGNAVLLTRGALAPAVHPHARGERQAPGRHAWIRCGSSPRPWGTPFRGRPMSTVTRFIPTPVGNACGRTHASRPFTVHPHARGER